MALLVPRLSFLWPRSFLRPRVSRPTTSTSDFAGSRPYAQASIVSKPIHSDSGLASKEPSPIYESQEPYFVGRTPSKQLPIYILAKRGGNLHQTRLKKIQGDIQTLRGQLQQALNLKSEEIAINQLTKHIIIKGWRKAEVTRFLEDRHF